MSTVNLSENQEKLVRKAALKCGFKRFDIVTNAGSVKGDNYLGVILAVTIQETNQPKALHLILKNAPTNEVFRKGAPIARMFKREADLYATVIPALQKLQQEKTISDPFTGVAPFYGSHLEDKHESVLMQNLKEYGYSLWDRMKPMDDEHVTLVFAEYARLHACSFAFKHQQPERFRQLTKDVERDVFDYQGSAEGQAQFRNVIATYFKSGLEAVRSNAKATAALERLRSNIGELFIRLTIQGREKGVVIHGDCWCNNLLFKYQDNQKTPSQVCFIDWQLSKVASPIIDLAYFFSACGTKLTFPNIDKYLNRYHEVLSQNLKEFGCDPNEVFSLEDLKEEWKKHCWFGLFLAMMIIKVMLSDSKEVPTLDDKAHGDVLLSLIDFDLSDSREFEGRLCDLVEFMVDNDYV